MRKQSEKRAFLSFSLGMILIMALFLANLFITAAYNRRQHHETFKGPALFSEEAEPDTDVYVKAVPRSSTWGKIFDFNNEGLTENNYQAFTYDFNITNGTRDVVSDFQFKLIFNREVYLASGWNGSMEIHQNVSGAETVEVIPDLREFHKEDYTLKTITVEGDSMVAMYPGDYLVYTPSRQQNALEVPIRPSEGTTPGIILYTAMGETIEDSVLEMEFTLHRKITSGLLFWGSILSLLVWLVALVIYTITSAQIRKYQERHERDNEIINESIETFTGFIDAKDPYTNGHSKRVASYTRLIAQQMGYEGEELDRIYYVALLHDCGKIGVPDNILGKPGRLTDEEFQIIKSHTVRGGEILKSFKSLKDADEGAHYHHERYDGKGYPEGLAGESIPLIARMICVADSFDAMNTNRVYRNKLTKEHILHEIESNRGTQFDPAIADIMLRLLKEGTIAVG